MNKKRNEYIYQLTGTIQGQKAKKASPKSKYAGQSYFDLTVDLESPYEYIKNIQVFKDKLTNRKIWTTIKQAKGYSPKYVFSCRNQKGYYYLVNMEEVK